MPSKVLASTSNSNNNHAPTTPGTKVRHLTAELATKETENEVLRDNVKDLVKALGNLELVNTKGPPSAVVDDKKKKTKCPVAPAKTAYKFWSETQPKKEGVSLQAAWKEVDAKVREPYNALAKADKARYVQEFQAYEKEEKALELYREHKKQADAMAFYEAHLEAQAAKEKLGDGKKKKKAAKDPDAPKRSMSSYMYFSQENRVAVAAENPTAKTTEIAKILGELWKTCEDKSTYEEQAAIDRERYVAEKAAYDVKVAERKQQEDAENQERLNQEQKDAMELFESQSVLHQVHFAASKNGDDISLMSSPSAMQKKMKKKKDPNAPKRALTAYNYFFQENREGIKAKLPATTTNGELLAQVGVAWKSLNARSKAKYEKLAAKDKIRFEKEMEQYTAPAAM